MWVDKHERAWRRRNEATQLHRAACEAESRFAAFDKAVGLLLSDPEGQGHLARYGITHRWCTRSMRVGKAGAEGMWKRAQKCRYSGHGQWTFKGYTAYVIS